MLHRIALGDKLCWPCSLSCALQATSLVQVAMTKRNVTATQSDHTPSHIVSETAVSAAVSVGHCMVKLRGSCPLCPCQCCCDATTKQLTVLKG
jgi:hypothetical protein